MHSILLWDIFLSFQIMLCPCVILYLNSSSWWSAVRDGAVHRAGVERGVSVGLGTILVIHVCLPLRPKREKKSLHNPTIKQMCSKKAAAWTPTTSGEEIYGTSMKWIFQRWWRNEGTLNPITMWSKVVSHSRLSSEGTVGSCKDEPEILSGKVLAGNNGGSVRGTYFSSLSHK